MPTGTGPLNYVKLFGDEKFPVAFKNTRIYSFETAISTTILALPLVVSLSCKYRLSPFYQTIYFLPVITPLIPMSIAWKWAYDYNYGVPNYLLSLVGLLAVPWLTDPSIALWVVIMMTVETARLRNGAILGRLARHPAQVTVRVVHDSLGIDGGRASGRARANGGCCAA